MSRRVRLVLLVLLGAAFVVRVVHALALAPDVTFLDDDNFYHLTANLLAEGEGYVRPLDLAIEGRSVPTAEHPPLYPSLLAVVAWLGGTGVEAKRVVGVVAGTAAVLVVALVTRRVAGDRPALVAAGLAAFYPSFVAADGSLMSEPLLGLLVGLVVLQGLRARERPSVAAFAALGVLLALATLTRSEALLLVPIVLAGALSGVPARRAALACVAVATTALVLTPWVVRNWAVFDRPLISTNDGTTLAGSNCPQTYAGPDLGWFVFACATDPRGRSGTEAEQMARLRSRGLRYARDRPGRAVVVAGVRVLTVWGLYKPARHFEVTGRPVRTQQAGIAVFYLVGALALAGLLALRRRVARPVVLLLLAPVIATTFTAALTHGNPRLRHGAEVVLIAPAAVALAALARRPSRARTLRGERRSATIREEV